MPSKAPPAAKPSKPIFDPFNSSATGHQRAENRLGGSTSWRDSRTLKLRQQFSSDAGGGKRLNDTVGAGSLDFGVDGRTENGGWEKGAKGLRTGGQRSIFESMGTQKEVERPTKRQKIGKGDSKPTKVVNPFTPFRKEDGTIRETSWPSQHGSPSDGLEQIDPIGTPIVSTSPVATHDSRIPINDDEEAKPVPQMFSSLTFYINGSTAPHSDHQIKHLVSQHGGNLSIALGRRTVTHVIFGRPSSNGGCGGGLASSKIQKEVTRLGGKAVRYVTADWIVESVEAGKRLPESRFEAMKLAPQGVPNVASMFQTKTKEKSESG